MYGIPEETTASASQCVGCGKCEKHCPQHIEIRKELKCAASELEDVKYKVMKSAIQDFFKNYGKTIRKGLENILEKKSFVLKGNIVYSGENKELCSIEGGYVVCENGICRGALETLPKNSMKHCR